MKTRVDELENDDSDDNEKSESLDVLVKSIRNTSRSIIVSFSIISKKLFDSSIFIDEKNSNIED